ncbi:LIC_13246 family protein [Leptospira santarosai]|uniref:Uncharacterized protein n=4 Tax=Leptospira santarosai TaxID=28183 RepID=A0A0E2BGR4_9LEPT|nr:hypothetical protein [Leptospira santarosai]EKO34530.1 hypothetical protein LEP1GSC179_3287 [Leptospira santarosai str. MOR084]EMJ47120.1 hypothetical protein LEP1GSC169_3709 [Leptospira santarosai str. HAI1349]EMO33887.1 hypothetical protein LEP1GSC175_2743 [Leptospira santarosai str. HAI821]EMO98656.1 hypothetical protein LEP1GSC120_1813 [Leptospira santarosai str. 200702252]EMP79584.1 hypothetical protein LEP1GSC162_1293 [Leptospira santarosai str. CBC1531]
MKGVIDPNLGKWMKLISRKNDFRKIVSTLNSFYIPKIPFSKLGEGQKMRIRLAQKRIQKFEVLLKKINDYEFIIFLQIENQFESWVYVDGIREEKERFLKDGKNDHPIFQYISISDLYENNCVFANEEETKILNSKDSA